MSSHGAVKKSFSLSELAQSISAQLEKTYRSSYWIRAEVSKLNHYPQSGHCYPQLVEKKDGKIIADLRGFILKSIYERTRKTFEEVTGKALGDGMQILFRCKVGYHPVYGLSLNILEIEPAYTLGEMARLRTEAIARLKRENLFALNKTQHLALLPRKIAVISVETSKGYRDFAETIANSPFSKAIEIRLYNALLQGDAAVDSIRDALKRIEQTDFEYNAVAIIRGGGGETGLDCYDTYRLARDICTFPAPVLTGIGHATNLTVVEQVAFKNLITPTDLAQFIMGHFADFTVRIAQAERSLKIFRKGWFELKIRELNGLRSELIQVAGNRTHIENRKLISIAGQLKSGISEILEAEKARTRYRIPVTLNQKIYARLSKCGNHMEALQRSTALASREQLKASKAELQHFSEKIRILDPANTLKRGFSITEKNGAVITDASQLKSGDQIETTFARGKVKSKIEEK
ncbi:MAG: exodeoxyribonuclease VII large subunit [Cryomorphaceae bacterium]|nr:exodeoxyribonuclease VII large subunit [Flavobacteriales bacterium]